MLYHALLAFACSASQSYPPKSLLQILSRRLLPQSPAVPQLNTKHLQVVTVIPYILFFFEYLCQQTISSVGLTRVAVACTALSRSSADRRANTSPLTSSPRSLIRQTVAEEAAPALQLAALRPLSRDSSQRISRSPLRPPLPPYPPETRRSGRPPSRPPPPLRPRALGRR